jgi:hypothetical protein
MLGLQRSDVSEHYPVNMNNYTQGIHDVHGAGPSPQIIKKMGSKWLPFDNSSDTSDRCIVLLPGAPDRYIHVHIAMTPILGQAPKKPVENYLSVKLNNRTSLF